MIHGELTQGGTAVLTPETRADLFQLEKLQYARKAPGDRSLFWWPYMRDLQRDLGARLAWSPGTAAQLRDLVAERERAKAAVPPEKIRALFSPETPPRDYQCQGISFLHTLRRALLGDDVGLGKTIQALGAILLALEAGETTRAVVVCPAGLKGQWSEQIGTFARRPLRTVISQGDRDRRALVYRSPWEVLILNLELVRIDYALLQAVAGSAGVVILDEASNLRNPDTETTGCFKSLFSKARRRIALTATPIEVGLSDLYSIMDWVEPRAFPSRKFFERSYVVWRSTTIQTKSKNGRRGFMRRRVPIRYRRLDEVRQKIQPAFLRRTASEVGLELPEIVVQWDLVDLGPEQRRVYEAIAAETEASGVLENLRGAALAAPLTGLRQACNSTELVRDEGPHRSAKVDRLLELMDREFAGERVILFTDYARFAQILHRELHEHRPALYTGLQSRKDRALAIAGFLAGDKRVLICTAAGEKGHNLQVAGVVVDMDLPWNPASIKQRLGRARRFGATVETIRLVNMVARDTIEDTVIRRRVYGRRKLFEDVFSGDELSAADPVGNLTAADLGLGGRRE